MTESEAILRWAAGRGQIDLNAALAIHGQVRGFSTGE